MKRAIVVLAVCMVSLATAASAQVDPYKNKRGYGGILLNTPVYDPRSKSYFELVRLRNSGAGSAGQPYNGARNTARQKKFGGVRGRLAIIRSKETQEFLIQTFKPRDENWIGLRMYCRGRVLFWIDGTILDRRKSYTNWGRKWHKKSYVPCKSRSKYAGIILTKFEGKMRWIAVEPMHYLRYMFVEYPTGRK